MREQHERHYRGTWHHVDIEKLSEEGKITIKEEKLFCIVDSFVNSSGKDCFASNEYLGKRCQMKPPDVSRAISRLEGLGLLIRSGFDGRSRYLRTCFSRIPDPGSVSAGANSDLRWRAKQVCAGAQGGFAPARKQSIKENNKENEYPPDKPAVLPTDQGNESPKGNSGGFQRIFQRAWERKYKKAYPFQSKDGALLKKVFLQLKGDRAGFREMLKRYFADNSNFFRGHSVAKLVGELPRWTAPAAPAPNGTEDGPRQDYNSVTSENVGTISQKELERLMEE